MCIYTVHINILSAHRIHINLKTVFYTHREHSPTDTIINKVLIEVDCLEKEEKKECERPHFIVNVIFDVCTVAGISIIKSLANVIIQFSLCLSLTHTVTFEADHKLLKLYHVYRNVSCLQKKGPHEKAMSM